MFKPKQAKATLNYIYNICRTIFYYIEKCVLTYVQQLNIIESLGNSVCIAWTAVKHDHGFLTKEYSTKTIYTWDIEIVSRRNLFGTIRFKSEGV